MPYLAVQDGPEAAQFLYDLTLLVELFTCALLAFERAYPAHIAHGGLYILHVKLVLQTYWQSVQRTNRLARVGEVRVQFPGGLDGVRKEDFV